MPDICAISAIVFNGLEREPPLQPLARGEVHASPAPGKRLDEFEDLVVGQRLCGHQNGRLPGSAGETGQARDRCAGAL